MACGASLDDPALALLRGLAEGVERIAGTRSCRPGDAAPADLDAAATLEPVQLAVRGRVPVVPSRERHAPYVLGRRLGDAPSHHRGDLVAVPHGAVSQLPGHWFPQGSTGLAAGPDDESAWRAAAYEIIERDHVTRWWHDGSPIHAVPVEEEVAAAAGPRVRVQGYLLPGPVAAPVVLACAAIDDADVLAVGAAARATLAEALRKAVEEALVSVAQAEALVAGRERGPLDHRPLRDYRAAMGPHFEAGLDLAHTAQLYLDPDAAAVLRQRLGAATAQADSTHVPTCPDPVAALREAGHDVIAVPLVHEDLDLTGLRVWRLLAPGAQVPLTAAVLNAGREATCYPVPLT